MSRPVIGFTQQIQLQWLEWTAQMALAGMSDADIFAELQNRLRPVISVGGDDIHSNRGKVVGILLKIWVKGSKDLRPFREEGLSHLAKLSVDRHLPVHWGMAIATYPFLGTIADAAGRLLRLQGGVTFSQVHRRVEERYGQRTSIRRGAERAFYSLVDWGVLQPTEEKAVYAAAPPMQLSDPALASWLVEAALLTSGTQSVPLATATQLPMLFPFALPGNLSLENGRLELLRQGLDNDVIMRVGTF